MTEAAEPLAQAKQGMQGSNLSAAQLERKFRIRNAWLLLLIVLGYLGWQFVFQLPIDYDIYVALHSTFFPIVLLLGGVGLLVNSIWFMVRRRSSPASADQPAAKKPALKSEEPPAGKPAGHRQSLGVWLVLAFTLLFLYFVIWPFFAAFIAADGDLDRFAEELQSSDSVVITWLWSFSDSIVSGLSSGGDGGSCSFQWPSGGGYYTTDPGGNQMYVAGAGGEPNASDCYNAYGTNMCDDPSGNQVNMDQLCSAYPCTPLCKRLGLP
ncbi:MAG: hypothetical protein WD751_10910 [Anaerolineales bacterium]